MTPTPRPPPPAPAGPAPDPRFPWKARGTRKPLSLWDRTKFLLLFALLFELLVWNEYVRFGPPETWRGRPGAGGLPAAVAAVARRSRGAAPAALLRERAQRPLQPVLDRPGVRRPHPAVRAAVQPVEPLPHHAHGRWLFCLARARGRPGQGHRRPARCVALFKAPACSSRSRPPCSTSSSCCSSASRSSSRIFWFLSRGGVDTIFPDDIETRFTDVWGQDHVLERVKENVVLLENPEAIEARGGHVPGGILLYGPPGTGKTLMAQAVAGETGKPFVFVEPGAFTAMFFGVGILKVKALFRRARKLALRYGGVILFFDEADTLGQPGRPHRAAAGAGHDARGPTRATRRPTSRATPGRGQPALRPARPTTAGTRWTRMGRAVDRFIAGSAMGGGSVLRRDAAGPADRAVGPGEAARLLQQVPAAHARHAAEAAAEVPDPAHDGQQPARGPRPGAAAPRTPRPALPGRVPEQGRQGADLRGLPREGEARAHAGADRAARDHDAVPQRREDQGHRERGADLRASARTATSSPGRTSSRRASSRSSGRPRTSSTSSGSGTRSRCTRPATRSWRG